MERYLCIEEREIGSQNLEAMYTEIPSPAGMAICSGLDGQTWRMWELVAHGLFGYRDPAPLRKLCYAFDSWQRVDFEAVMALSEVMEEMEPGWLAAVSEARTLSDNPRFLSAWTGLHPYSVLAAQRTG